MKIDKIDKLASQSTRMRAIKRVHGCEKCLRPKFDIQKENGDIFPAWQQLYCAHLIPRTRRSVRYDPENLVGLCYHCHRLIDNDHIEKERFCLELLGEEEYNKLKGRMRQTHPKPDEALLTIYYTQQIKELDNELL